MNKTQALKRLKAYGTAQNRKVYARHGMVGKVYGVSYANLGKLKKEIEVDQKLAEQLWASRVFDAQVLATMIADPRAFKASLLDTWGKELSCRAVAGALSGIAAKTQYGKTRMAKWIKARDPWTQVAGWYTLCDLTRQAATLTDGKCETLIEQIETTIHASHNGVRYAMNSALISLGARNAKLEKKALAAAKRIGRLEIDHGETGCITPDAVIKIPKAAAQARNKAAKQR